MDVSKADIEVLRGLAAQVAEIAALPIQEEKRVLWRKLNGLQATRPMVMIDQVCWHEMDQAELELVCVGPDCRGYEQYLRRTLYQWNHFPVDMVVEPFIRVDKAVTSTTADAELDQDKKYVQHAFSIGVTEDTAETDPENDVVSHRYINQFKTDEDLEKIEAPVVSHDGAETARRLEMAHEIFDGLMEVRPSGIDPYLSLWDPIATWMGVENVLYALVDRPDYMHRLVERVTNGYISWLDQLEEQGLLCEPQSLIHCTGAYTDELPAQGYNSEHPRARDLWMFGLAQMFATVSPDMFKEFEVDYASRMCERFGLVYYGCCDPLDGKMDEVRMIPNVRKISMSPWADQERGAAEINGDYVFSRKPSPALVAMDELDGEEVRKDLLETRRICDKHGCAVEFILKDISTVRYEPARLTEWSRIAMEVVRG